MLLRRFLLELLRRLRSSDSFFLLFELFLERYRFEEINERDEVEERREDIASNKYKL